MRKLTIVLMLSLATASSAGCCGRCRSWFQKGSPCGTTMSPALLSAPLAMGAPMSVPTTAPVMQAPVMQGPVVYCEPSPAACVPCDPCMQYDPCATNVGSGYMAAPSIGSLPMGASADPGPLAP